MIDTSQLKHHPLVETLVDILSDRTQNPDKAFFTILVCYHLTKCASMMRASVDAKGLGKLPVNFYGINAAPSGYGKGYSTSIMEEQVLHRFNSNYMEMTMPHQVDIALADLAVKRANSKGTDDQEELESVKAEFKKLGAYLTSFDSGTVPAVKQFRHRLLMSKTGSINFEVDEMGSNLLNNKEMVDAYLELYDGVIKPKLTKNTADSVRNEEVVGKSPTNMMMFGTASMLLDGAQTEKTYMDMLLTGYARRCFFGYSVIEVVKRSLSVEERFKALTDTSHNTKLELIASKLGKLADPIHHNWVATVGDDVMRQILEYQVSCEEQLEHIRMSDEIRRAELRGRHHKTIKLAGVFAFLDISKDVTKEHWEAAVKVAEMSAKCFNEMLTRDPTHARLGKYLAEAGIPMTSADLIEELPYFPKSGPQQKDLLKHAIAWGYKNNVIIKRTFTDDIEFFQGDALKETDINAVRLSYSMHVAEGYQPQDKVPFHKIGNLTKLKDAHWCSHHFIDGIRRQSHVIKGVNLIVIDVDGTATLDEAKAVLQDYTYHIYTTKRHTPQEHRFRIVLPMSHTLKLSADEYTEFMKGVLQFLPFRTDEQTSQANRKWLSNPDAEVFENEGKLFDVLPFIPKTKKAEEFQKFVSETGNMDGLERFFHKIAEEGNRNNTIARYAFALIDSGHDLDTATKKVQAFNKKLANPLPNEELENTVINSMTRKYYQQG